MYELVNFCWLACELDLFVVAICFDSLMLFVIPVLLNKYNDHLLLFFTTIMQMFGFEL